jgi:polyhydroxyalkanoate synthesis repressor PhaR
MPPKPILIRKYENRRLYDATNSRYVNLEEVAQFLRDGHDVRVEDAATGKDITRLILTQIIIEDAKTPDSAFPLDLLRQMIVTSGRASQETALHYMKAMLEFYQDTYRAMSPAVNPFGIFRPGFAGPAPSSQEQSASSPPTTQTTAASAPETEEMKKRIADLEKLVSSIKPQKAASRRKRSAKSRS